MNEFVVLSRRMRFGLPRIGFVLILCLAASLLSALPAQAASPVVIGMPFTGKWAYNVNVDPPYTDANSSYPQVHAKYYGDWATDLYAAEGTQVRLSVSGTGLSFQWVPRSNGTCGQRTVIEVFSNGADLGSVYYEHLQNAVTSGPISNGMVVGNVHNWGSCNPGPHTHVELKNAVGGTYSCWTDNGHPGVSLAAGVAVGQLGSGNGSPQQSCAAGGSGAGVPGSPTGLAATALHGSRIQLSWNSVAGAASYDLIRDGVTLASTTSPGYLDTEVSPGMTYYYAVAARNGSGASAVTVVQSRNDTENADHAYLGLATGPTECGRSGDQAHQTLVCNPFNSAAQTWASVSSQLYDWGYATDRAWVPTKDGNVAYCRRIYDGDQLTCEVFNGQSWAAPKTSPKVDVGYADGRTWVTSAAGPTECGRAGDQSSQFLVCNTFNTTSQTWVSAYSQVYDWGYASDRAWVQTNDGNVAYCRRIYNGDQLTCEVFNGQSWTGPKTSPKVDTGYAENRAWVTTAAGPTECGRAGDQSSQFLVCNTFNTTSQTWVSAYSQVYDWGYASDRAWVQTNDGNVAYCRRIYNGDQLTCEVFNGQSWMGPKTSPRVDVGYPENRTWVTTTAGPTECGRAGDQSYQGMVCNTFNMATQTWVSAYSQGYDWGYATDRAWVPTRNGSVAYCRRVNNGDQLTCDIFNGQSWTGPKTSPRLDAGYL